MSIQAVHQLHQGMRYNGFASQNVLEVSSFLFPYFCLVFSQYSIYNVKTLKINKLKIKIAEKYFISIKRFKTILKVFFIYITVISVLKPFEILSLTLLFQLLFC